MKNDLVYVQHILEAIAKIERYIEGVDFKSFSSNDMMVDAVVKELEIIGEAANQCGPHFRKQNPRIPWEEMIGMRNRLIHEYFGIALDIVWTTCAEDLPFLKKTLAQFIKK